MKIFTNLLLLTVSTFLLSGCSPLSVLYKVYNIWQDLPAPHHVLEANSDYEVIWDISNVTVANGYGVSMVGAQGRIIIQGWKDYTFPSHRLIGLESINGNIAWTVPDASGGEIIAQGEILYRGTVGTAKVKSYNIENGGHLWSTWLPWSHSVPNIYYADNKIFAYTSDFDFYVLNEQGDIIDHFRETDRTYLEIDGILYMEYFEDGFGIQAVDYFSREVLWRLKQVGVPVFDNGAILLATSTDIYSLDQLTGKVNWNSSQTVLSNLFILGQKIYFINIDGSLIALDRETGDELSNVKFSPSFNFDKQHSGYFVAGDPLNNILAVSLGDNGQIMGLRLNNP